MQTMSTCYWQFSYFHFPLFSSLSLFFCLSLFLFVLFSSAYVRCSSVIDTDRLLFYSIPHLLGERPLVFHRLTAWVRFSSHRLRDYFASASLSSFLCPMSINWSCPSHLCVNAGRRGRKLPRKKGDDDEEENFSVRPHYRSSSWRVQASGKADACRSVPLSCSLSKIERDPLK